MVNLEYQLTGYGCAHAALEINGKRVEIGITYLCSPIHSLLEGLLSIIPDYAVTTHQLDGTKTKDTKAKFLWLTEPGSYLWELSLIDGKTLKVEIKFAEDYTGYAIDWKDADTDKILFDAECGLDEFVKAVTRTFDDLFRKNGALGYKDQWDRNNQDDFPVAELLLLKYYVLNGKAWQLVEGARWSFDDEIKLIGQELDRQ